MGFRYRSRIRLGKGLWINLSKSGPSVSAKAGPLTVNSRGRETIHLAPGLSYTTQAHHTCAARPSTGRGASGPANRMVGQVPTARPARQWRVKPQTPPRPLKPVGRGVFRTLQVLCWVSAAMVLILALGGPWPAAVVYGLFVAFLALVTHSMRSRVIWHRPEAGQAPTQQPGRRSV